MSRFSRLAAKFKREGKESPKGLAAFIGRKKYGDEEFEKMAMRGKKVKKKGR